MTSTQTVTIDFSVYALAPEIPSRRSVHGAGKGWSRETGHRISQVELSHEDCHGRIGWMLTVTSRQPDLGAAREQCVGNLWIGNQPICPHEERALQRQWFLDMVDSTPEVDDVLSGRVSISVDGESTPFEIFRLTARKTDDAALPPPQSTGPTLSSQEAAAACGVDLPVIDRNLEDGSFVGAFEADGVWRIPMEDLLAAGLPFNRPMTWTGWAEVDELLVLLSGWEIEPEFVLLAKVENIEAIEAALLKEKKTAF